MPQSRQVPGAPDPVMPGAPDPVLPGAPDPVLPGAPDLRPSRMRRSMYMAWWARWKPPTPMWTIPVVIAERS